MWIIWQYSREQRKIALFLQPNTKNRIVLTINQQIAGLESADEKQILKSLAVIKGAGNIKVLRPMAKLLLEFPDTKISTEVIEIFSSLKTSKAVDEIMEILKDDSFAPVHQKLLPTIWNTQLDYSFYVADFVLFAADGDFLQALDCLTILENMIGPFEERHILESQWHLKEWMEDNAPKEERKKQIMSDIAIFVKEADQGIEA